MPWRENLDPYWILVSEVMLQQTQVSTVIPKFQIFIEEYPTVQALANANMQDLLKHWQGLGYNSRAIRLRDCAKEILTKHQGNIPNTIQELDNLPGIGYATAAAIIVYAYNQPYVFIETNIRRIILHYLMESGDNKKQTDIKTPDSVILPLVAELLDRENPREWYWALMDYGAHLKKILPLNPNTRSKTYSKQKKFDGSVRQMRGQILKNLINNQDIKALYKDPRFETAVKGLVTEGLVTKYGDSYSNNTIRSSSHQQGFASTPFSKGRSQISK
jgi:A/G-specific adenine glycosylase